MSARNLFVDLDNTLIDSAELTYPVIERLMADCVVRHLAIEAPPALSQARERGSGITAVGLRRIYGIDPHHFLQATHPQGLAKAAITRNHRIMNWFATAPADCWITSDGPLHNCEEAVEALGISRWVRGIFALDTMQCIPKAVPDYFTNLSKLIGVRAASCVLLDDNRACLRSAMRAGLTAVSVRRPGRLPAHASWAPSCS